MSKRVIFWVRDEVVLAVFNKAGLPPVTDEVINVSEVNRKLSAENRARKVALDPERVENVNRSYEKSIPVPMIIVRRTPSDGYVIISGNHRFNGLPDWVELIHVHVMECTDKEFQLACPLANGPGGSGISKEDRIEAAVRAYKHLGLSLAAAAETFDTTKSAIQDAIRHKEVAAKMHSFPPRVRSSMTHSHLKILGDLSKNENVFRAACFATAHTKATTSELAELARLARIQPTEADQMGVFQRFMEAQRDEKNRVIPKKIKKSFLTACSTIKAFKENKTWQSLEFSRDQIEDAKELAKEVRNILDCLCRANG